jgi:AcrR family transcriptional regulator
VPLVGAARVEARRVSLRERRKDQTRAEIRAAAVRLAVDDDWERISAEDIAELAGVSPRTFYRYFPTKEAAVVPVLDPNVALFAQSLQARPPEEDLFTALCRAYAHAAASDPVRRRETSALVRIFLDVPTLRERWLDSMRSNEEQLAPVIHARAGGRLDELEARLTAAAVVAAVRIPLELSDHQDEPIDVAAAFEDGMRHLRRGLGIALRVASPR